MVEAVEPDIRPSEAFACITKLCPVLEFDAVVERKVPREFKHCGRPDEITPGALRDQPRAQRDELCDDRLVCQSTKHLDMILPGEFDRDDTFFRIVSV
jgi:hypothetical protein